MDSTREVPEVSPPTEAFLKASAEAGIVFDDGDLDRLQAYLQLLYDANSRMNLTGIRDPDEAWMRHIFDSLTLLPWVTALAAEHAPLRVLDVGAGGGLPGIPLACVMAEAVQLTMVESTGKKAEFLAHAVEALGLVGCTVERGRAEDAGSAAAHREQYHVVVSRAVGRLQVLLELTVPFCREDGVVLAIKGKQAQEEVAEAKQALHMLHAKVVDVVQTETGRIVVVEKSRPTPAKYPRMPGEPNRRPLGSA